MLRKIIYSTLIVVLTAGAAAAQPDLEDIQGGQNSLRDEREKKNDRSIDRAYQSTIKRFPEIEKKKPDPWGDVRPSPPLAGKDKQR